MRRVGLVVGAMVFLALALAPAFAAQQPFADVPQDHWAYDAIARLAENGVIEGFPDGTFKGKRNMTRYEFAVAIARVMDQLGGGPGAQGTPGAPGRVGPPGPPGPPGPGLTAEQQALLERLANEFAPELRALRADLEALTNRVAALEARGPAVPRVSVSGAVGWRTGVYGTELSLSESTVSTGYPAFNFTEFPFPQNVAFGNIPVVDVVGEEVLGFIPISDSLKDSFKVNDFMVMRTFVNLTANISENTTAMVSLLASPNTNLINPVRDSFINGQEVFSPAAFSGNGIMDTVQIDEAYATYGTRFITPTMLTIGKQYLHRGVGLLFDNSQASTMALRADFGSGNVRVGTLLGMLNPDAFLGRTAPIPIGEDQFGNAIGMYGVGAEAIVSGSAMYEASGQDNYNLFYVDLGFIPGWTIGGNWLESGFNREQGWSASLTGCVLGLDLYGEFATLTQWPNGTDFADLNLNGIKDPGEGDIDKSNEAWLAGLTWNSPWLELTGEYGRVDAGYAFAPAFGGWDAVGFDGFFNLPLSALHPRAEIDPYDINWVDRPLFLDPTNIAKGWHAVLNFPTLLGEGNSLKVSWADGKAYTPEFLGWLFTGATGDQPDEWRDADPVWTVSLSRRMSDVMTASILYGRREVDNVMSPQVFPVAVVDDTPIFSTDDPIQVIRAEVAVQF